MSLHPSFYEHFQVLHSCKPHSHPKVYKYYQQKVFILSCLLNKLACFSNITKEHEYRYRSVFVINKLACYVNDRILDAFIIPLKASS